jgi:putative transposase
VKASVSRGDSYDNALAESLEDVEFATLEWVWWFNYHYLLGPIGHVPPAEYEEEYYNRLETPAETSTLNSPGLR